MGKKKIKTKADKLEAFRVDWLDELTIGKLQKHCLDNPVSVAGMDLDAMAARLTENFVVNGFYRVTAAIIIPDKSDNEFMVGASVPIWIASAEFLDPETSAAVSIDNVSKQIEGKLFMCCAAALEGIGMGAKTRKMAMYQRTGWQRFESQIQFVKPLTDIERKIVLSKIGTEDCDSASVQLGDQIEYGKVEIC